MLGDPQIAGRRIPLGHLEDLPLERGRGLIGYPGLAAWARNQPFSPELLKGLLDLVIVAAADPGPAAGQGDV